MINNSEIIGAIDIGTTKIAAIAGRKIFSDKIEVVAFATTPSKGIKRGAVLNIDDTVSSIKKVLNIIKEECGIELSEVYVGIAGQHVIGTKNRCSIVIDTPDKVIKSEHLTMLYNKMKNQITDPGEEVLEIIPQSYIVDKTTGIENPIGMTANLLEGNFHVISGKMSMVNNIKKCVSLADLKIKALFLEPLASAEAVLTPQEKESGVALIDIGGGTSDLAIFKNEKVLHTAVIPIGGNTVTMDIKNRFGILEKQAEELKIKHGYALAEKHQEDVKISVEPLKGREPVEFSLYELNETIQARMEEIIHAIMFQIETGGIREKLPGGIVMTGGGSLLKNLKQLTKYISANDVRIALPTDYISGQYSEIINQPQYSTAVGLLIKGIQFEDAKDVEEKSVIENLNTKEERIEEEDKTKNKAPKNPDDSFLNKLKTRMTKLFDDEE